MTGFAELGVSETRVARLKALGIVDPTPVQAETIPIVARGQDVISQAQTGTGKTLAFVLPMLQKIDTTLPHIQGLIVTPTRELALQITTEIKKLIKPEDGIKVLAVYGGQDVEAQLIKLKGNIHLVVATPGRLLDHLRRETVSLSRVSMLVLDEADQMLHMGFLSEVEEILRNTPPERQTMLFSATMPPSIRDMAGRILRNPEHVTVKSERITVKDIRQWVVETTDRGKQATLVKLLEVTQPYLSIIFCRTKRRASALNQALQEMGYASDELHGDLSQAKREKVMKLFRDARLQLLVATDVAARGLDVEGVTHVFNYDIPQDVESYIHRIGRTGRAGETGLAITLVAPRDQRELAEIENGIEQAIERRSVDGKPLGGANALVPRKAKPFGNGGRDANRRGGGGKPKAGGFGRKTNERGSGRAPAAGASGRRSEERGYGRAGTSAATGGRKSEERSGPGRSGPGRTGEGKSGPGFGRPGSTDRNAGGRTEQRDSFGRSSGPRRGGGGARGSQGPSGGNRGGGRSSNNRSPRGR